VNRRLATLALVPVLPLVLLTACSSASSSAPAASGSSNTVASTSASAPASAPASAAVGGGVALESQCGEQSAPISLDVIPEGPTAGGVTVIAGASAADAPAVVVASDAPAATKLESLDVQEGTGAAAKAGDTLTVQYCGVTVPEGALFDSSWIRGEAATFPLDGLIAGWQEGIPGMKVGGTRLLVIPPALAYGEDANAHELGGRTLAFVITLTDIAAG